MDPYQKGSVRYVDYHVNGMLLKREWYGTSKLVTEYFEKASSSGEVITIKMVASPLKNSSKEPVGYIG